MKKIKKLLDAQNNKQNIYSEWRIQKKKKIVVLKVRKLIVSACIS